MWNKNSFTSMLQHRSEGVLAWGCKLASELASLGNVAKRTALNVRPWCLYNCPQIMKTSPQFPLFSPVEHICHQGLGYSWCYVTDSNAFNSVINDEPGRKNSLMSSSQTNKGYVLQYHDGRIEFGRILENAHC
ncbi:hypothetical protein TNCV_2704771 [Trichonephila clavipes]|nr:hypothetical protein TNCV_2704771 [Trichonephila clavipes]